MKNKFDVRVDRRGSGCYKWDHFGDPPDVLQMWIADMDFPTPDVVKRAIAEKNRVGIYGYDVLPDSFGDSFSDWMIRRHSTHYPNEWIVPVPGVLTAISLAIRSCTEPGGGIVVQPPVYSPFLDLPAQNGRSAIINELVQVDPDRERLSTYSIDFDALETSCSDAAALLFCSPHNPAGRVWSETELDKLLEMALRTGILVISDEIHQDFVMPGYTHHPLIKRWLEIGGDPSECPVITVTAATKSFNLAGLSCGYLIAPDPVCRNKIKKLIGAEYLWFLNSLAVAATTEAYRSGEIWFSELLTYLDGNRNEAIQTLVQESAIRVHRLEGTYLLWIDFRHVDKDDIGARLVESGVRLNDGEPFGAPGFYRMNLAAPRSVVSEGAARISAAVGLAG